MPKFFFSDSQPTSQGRLRVIRTLVGPVGLPHHRGRELGVDSKSPISPALEKCCLRMCAKTSYEQASEDLEAIMGIKISHSSLHRMVSRIEQPASLAEHPSEAMSVDGGKVCLRTEQGSQWRDDKLIRLHGSVSEGFFQDPAGLQSWYAQQPRARLITCLGDGHDGVWNVMEQLTQGVPICRQVLDWYHLKENLYKVGGSLKRLETVESLLWHGWVEAAIAAFEGLNRLQAKRFQQYLRKHRHRLPDYRHYQRMGIPIGSGAVESKIKQVSARLKISGARWRPENVPKMLRLRCAYLNRSSCLSISTAA
nr:ISKra4 family transposase [Lyngbya confervoides]